MSAEYASFRRRTKLFLGRICQTQLNSTQLRRNTMKVNKWTLALAATGVVSLGSVMQAE